MINLFTFLHKFFLLIQTIHRFDTCSFHNIQIFLLSLLYLILDIPKFIQGIYCVIFIFRYNFWITDVVLLIHVQGFCTQLLDIFLELILESFWLRCMYLLLLLAYDEVYEIFRFAFNVILTYIFNERFADVLWIWF